MESERKIKELTEKLEEVTESYIVEQVKNDNLTSELKNKQKVLDEKNEIISILRKQVFDLQSTLNDAETSLEQRKDTNENLRKRCENLEKEIQELYKTQTHLEGTNEELTEKVETRTKQTEQFAIDLVNARVKLEEMEKRCDELKTTNEELREQLRSLNAQRRLNSQDSPLLFRMRSVSSPQMAVADSPRILNASLKFENLNDIQMAEYQEENLQLQNEIQQLKENLSEREQLLQSLEKNLSEKEKKIQQLSQELQQLENSSSGSNNSNQAHPPVDHDISLLVQELYDLRAQVKSANHRATELARNEELDKVKKELDLVETSWRAEKVHKERYAKENMQLERQVFELKKEYNAINQKCNDLIELNRNLTSEIEKRQKTYAISNHFNDHEQNQNEHDQNIKEISMIDHSTMRQDQLMTNKDHLVSDIIHSNHQPVIQIKVPRGTANNLTIADEVGEMMNSTALPPRNTLSCRPMINGITPENQHFAFRFATPGSQNKLKNNNNLFNVDNSNPIKVDDKQARYERMNELARRNMQQKPLHRSTYALELDTFDQIGLSETEFKRGRLLARPALADQSNNQHSANKIPNRAQVRKPCSFIVN